MSRSFRKVPISSITTSSSDKAFKQAEHRRARVAERTALAHEDEPPAPKAYGNPWSSPKDGKRWHGFGYPSAMRK